jgi:bacteriorhodopsin
MTNLGIALSVGMPPLLAAIGIAVTLRMSNFKWAVHILVFAGLLFVPMYSWADIARGAIDDGPPGPMDGLSNFMPLIAVAYVAIFGTAYAGYAYVTRTRSQDQVGSTV